MNWLIDVEQGMGCRRQDRLDWRMRERMGCDMARGCGGHERNGEKWRDMESEWMRGCVDNKEDAKLEGRDGDGTATDDLEACRWVV